jgi:hypothetical protein
MHHVNVDKKLESEVLRLHAEDIPDDTKLSTLCQLIQRRISEQGREIQGEPTVAAILEERVNLTQLTTRQKLDQCRDILEFIAYMKDLIDGIPSPVPEIVRKASALTPAVEILTKPLRRNRN